MKKKLICFFYKSLLKIFKVKKNKILFIDGVYLNNTKSIYNILKKEKKYECNFLVKEIKEKEYPVISIKSPMSLYHLATSEYWIVHSHLEPLFKIGIYPSSETKYIQIWHATGAIKKFGRDSEGITLDNKEVLKIETNYINKIIVSSEIWKQPFASAFGVNINKIKVLGSPRTDFFFDEDKKEKEKEKIYNTYPQLKNKKVILYAPTFRDDNLEENIKLDLNLMKKKLGDNYIIILKLHPHMKNITIEENKDVYNFSNYHDINHLFLVADILITDYSSVALEFAILEKEIIFYAYDLEKYKKEIRGFYYDYEDFIIKNSLAKTTEDVIDIIKNKKIKKSDIVEFKNKNFKFLDGKSSERFFKEILEGKI